MWFCQMLMLWLQWLMVFSRFEASFKTFYMKYCSINIAVIRFLFTSLYSANLLYVRKSMVLWSANQQVLLQIYSFLVALFQAGTLLAYYLFIGYLNWTFWSVVTCERGPLPRYFHFTFSKPQVTEDVSPRPSTLNRKRHPIEVTMIG